MVKRKTAGWVIIVVSIVFFLFQGAPARAKNLSLESIGKQIGPTDAFLIADDSGKVIYSKNADRLMIPASTLKILTSLAAFHYLGKDYRFITEFYLDNDRNLTIKGYGDPLMVSEEIRLIAQQLASRTTSVNELIVNDSYFGQPLSTEKISDVSQPYNASSGALCVNFNTVNFRKGKKPGTFISAEPQTPLVPFALERIKRSGISSGRILLSNDTDETALYAGHLFKAILERNGIKVGGKVWHGWVTPEEDKLLYRHQSRFTVEQIVRQLLEFSNNFTANQLLIASGAKHFGPPGNLIKGAEAASAYALDVLGLKEILMDEGSGISRKNRISAENMLKVLEGFRPHYTLMKKKDNAYYKTGTLKGVNNLAGYIEMDQGRLYPFVIFINTPAKTAMPILDAVIRMVK